MARTFSSSPAVSSEHHEEHHDDHHHHGPGLSPAESPINKTTIYLGVLAVGIVTSYSINKSYENSSGKTILQSLLGSQNDATSNNAILKEYRETVGNSVNLFQTLQFNQPERKFHEFTADRVVPSGSLRSAVPGNSIDVSTIGPRRERTKFFKDL